MLQSRNNSDIERTRIRQQPQQQTEHQQERVNAATAAAATATATTRYTEPGVLFERWDRQVIAEAYTATIGQRLSLPVMQLMERCLREGMEAGVILAAIEATGWARRPSPAYLRAILTRCLREGILTEAVWMHHEAERAGYQQTATEELFRAWYGVDNMPF